MRKRSSAVFRFTRSALHESPIPSEQTRDSEVISMNLRQALCLISVSIAFFSTVNRAMRTDKDENGETPRKPVWQRSFGTSHALRERGATDEKNDCGTRSRQLIAGARRDHHPCSLYYATGRGIQRGVRGEGLEENPNTASTCQENKRTTDKL